MSWGTVQPPLGVVLALAEPSNIQVSVSLRPQKLSDRRLPSHHRRVHDYRLGSASQDHFGLVARLNRLCQKSLDALFPDPLAPPRQQTSIER